MAETFLHHLEILWGALIALGIVVALTPAVGGMARLLGAVDRPGGRRVNRSTVPRLGGLALFLGFVVPALAFLDLNREARGLLVGAGVAVVVGAVDDFRGLAWWEKLGGQLLAASVPVLFGVWVTRFTFPFVGVHQLPEWLGMTVTILGIAAIMNMLNFLDGLDGLAAGVAAIAGFTFCLIALSLDKPQTALVSAIVFGACIGFLRHNFYPARIFMGDSGALLLGFVLATLSVQGLLKTAALATLVLPLLVLAIPIIDTSFVIAKRLKYRRPLWLGDRTHLHHRFVDIGFSQRRAVGYLYAWCLTLAGAALATRFLRPRPHGDWLLWPTVGVAVVAVAAIGSSIYIAYLLEIVKLANPRIRRREDEARAGERRSA